MSEIFLVIRYRRLQPDIISTYLYPCVSAVLENPVGLVDYDKISAVMYFALAYHPVICSPSMPVFYLTTKA